LPASPCSAGYLGRSREIATPPSFLAAISEPSHVAPGCWGIAAASNGNCNCSDHWLRSRIRRSRVGFPPAPRSGKAARRPVLSCRLHLHAPFKSAAKFLENVRAIFLESANEQTAMLLDGKFSLRTRILPACAVVLRESTEPRRPTLRTPRRGFALVAANFPALFSSILVGLWLGPGRHPGSSSPTICLEPLGRAGRPSMSRKTRAR
jgi:hypothetical protein